MSETIKIDPFGFREYDARWLYPKNINGAGIREVGKGFGSQIIKVKKNARVTVGYDYRSYSEEVKNHFVDGLISTGCNVEDLGLCLSPTIYFSQFDLNSDAVAMITRYGGTDQGNSTYADLAGIASGTYTYQATGINGAAATGSGSGTIDSTVVIDFAAKTITQTVSGTVAL